MSLLDLHSDEMQAAAAQTTWTPQPLKAKEPGMFDNFGSGTGRYFMRSMAEAGRSVSMAVGAVPAAVDKVMGKDNFSGKPLADRYFEVHDEVFGRAVDYWTPKPEEVGAAGQVVGSLAGGVLQFVASPALAVANAQLSTSEELVRQGVDVDAALVAGDIAGLGTVAGIALPTLGGTLAKRVSSGVGGNLVQSVATAAATQGVLKAADAPAQVVTQYDPLDERGRFVDVLMGAAFGVKAHIDAKRAPAMTPTQRDATMVLNQARHLEEAALPSTAAKPADLTTAVESTLKAIDQILQGEPVNVRADVPLDWNDPKRSALRAEIAQVVLENTQPYRDQADATAPLSKNKPDWVPESPGKLLEAKSGDTQQDVSRTAGQGQSGDASIELAAQRGTPDAPVQKGSAKALTPETTSGGYRTVDQNGAEFNPVALANEATNLLAGGKTADQVIGELQATGAKVSPELQNMVIGVSEFGGRVNDLVDQVKALQSQRGANAQGFDLIAQAVDNLRNGRVIEAPRTEAEPVFDESLRIPTGEFDPATGEAVAVPANEYVAKVRSEAQTTKNTAKAIFQTAADCLLGGL